MTVEREQAVGARLRAERMARGLTLIGASTEGLKKSSISLIERTPAGEELLPCADAYARRLGYELVRRFDYELRRLPVRADDSKARASEAADSIRPSKSGRRRRRGVAKTSSSRATASRASSTSRSGKRRTTTSRRRASRGGR